jgi:hypothetical protein
VRWAGCGFNVRKIVVDLSSDPSLPPKADAARAHTVRWSNTLVPVALVAGHDHGTIFSDPMAAGGTLVTAVERALGVEDEAAYQQWAVDFPGWTPDRTDVKTPFQQFVTHVVDERGDGVPDYFIEIRAERDGTIKPLEEFEQDVHAWKEDPSYRCFHVNLNALGQASKLYLHLAARSGTRLVSYYGHRSERTDQKGNLRKPDGVWDAVIELPETLRSADGRPVKIFWPFTTTLLEIRLNREPSFGDPASVFWWHLPQA